MRESKYEFDKILEEHFKDYAKLVVSQAKPIIEKTYSNLRFKVAEEDDFFINNIINVGGWVYIKVQNMSIETRFL